MVIGYVRMTDVSIIHSYKGGWASCMERAARRKDF